MSDLKAVVYVSRATRPMSPRDLEFLLIEVRAFNEKLKVTGALLHHDGVFFQYLEGPADSIGRVYHRIKQSRRHDGLIELLNQPIATLQFPRWPMAFAEAPRTTLQALTNEIWAMTLPALNQSQAVSPGLELLLNFCDMARRSNAA